MNKSWKQKIHDIIFEADTKAGKLFDVILLWVIILSIFVVMLESVEDIQNKYGNILNIIEWIVTIFFTIEYLARVISVKKPTKYIFSTFGIIDLLATIPKYLALFFVGSQYVVVIRTLRLLRVFRIFKLGRYMSESKILIKALKDSRPKIIVFIGAVVTLSVILGTIMYIVEGPENGFTSIPKAIYWTIVTMTTVGYGDIAPNTVLGQIIASMLMIVGYGIIAVPTGIVTSEYVSSAKNEIHTNTQSCENCTENSHTDNAEYCHNCGSKMR